MFSLPTRNGDEIRHGAARVIKHGPATWVVLIDGSDDFRWGNAAAIRKVIAHVVARGAFAPSKYTQVL